MIATTIQQSTAWQSFAVPMLGIMLRASSWLVEETLHPLRSSAWLGVEHGAHFANAEAHAEVGGSEDAHALEKTNLHKELCIVK
jgi:hypothetical protein